MSKKEAKDFLQAQEGTIDQVKQEQDQMKLTSQGLIDPNFDYKANLTSRQKVIFEDDKHLIILDSGGHEINEIADKLDESRDRVSEVFHRIARKKTDMSFGVADPIVILKTGENESRSRTQEDKQTAEKYLHGELSLQEALEQEQEDTLDWARRSWEQIAELFAERVEALLPNRIREPEQAATYSELPEESISVGLVNEGQLSNAREAARLELDRNHMKGSLELSLKRNKGEGQTSTVSEQQVPLDRSMEPAEKFDVLHDSINEFIRNVVKPELR